MLAAVAKKEVRQTVRDRRMMALLIVAPIIQLYVFGHAVDLEVDRVPVVVVDHDGSDASRTHLARLFADGTLVEVGRAPDAGTAERALERGEAAVALVIPPGFGDDVARGRTARVQAVLDGSDPNRASVAAAAIGAYFATEGASLARARLAERAAVAGASARAPDVRVETRVLFNPRLDTAVYMVPGVAAMLLMLITTIVSAMGLAREREVGTLEQILVTPVPAAILILGKVLPFAAVGLFDFGIALAVGAFVFDMPLHGDVGVLVLSTVLYLGVTLGVGLLIATHSGTQQQAFLGGFLFMLPAALLSGIMTPIRSMPEWLQPLTLVNPLRHYAEVLRGSLLRGAGLEALAEPLAILAVMGLVVFGYASLRFRAAMMK
ncbi:MAG: ABC transporter permease [Sandaracinaceae bacterium]|nr:ABC transporter permease [Sandaracinaceae bacterium]